MPGTPRRVMRNETNCQWVCYRIRVKYSSPQGPIGSNLTNFNKIVLLTETHKDVILPPWGYNLDGRVKCPSKLQAFQTEMVVKKANPL